MTEAATREAELIRQMLAGDEAAFGTLYDRCRPGVYRFAWQMCGSPDVAEDVTQEVFMLLIREGHKFDPSRAALTTYLIGIARNFVLRHLDKQRRWVALENDTEDEPSLAATLADPLDLAAEFVRKADVERVRTAILNLPPLYREIIVLCELNEMSYEEAAQMLECPIGTVRSRLSRARTHLAKRLQPVTQPRSSLRSAAALVTSVVK